MIWNQKWATDLSKHCGVLQGYCFVEYPGSEIAENATAILHGYLLDKNHTFSANLFNDLNKFEKPDENWKPPEIRPYNNIVLFL